MTPNDIDVRYEPDHEAVGLSDGRPTLTWGEHPVHGNGWTLWYVEPDGDGIDDYFIPGDVTDADYAVKQATDWLNRG